MIVAYDDRAVEVQLRTQVMHEWAITVERLSGRLQQDLKGGQGPEPVLDLFEAVSEAMALEEEGHVVGEALASRISELRVAAISCLGGGHP